MPRQPYASGSLTAQRADMARHGCVSERLSPRSRILHHTHRPMLFRRCTLDKCTPTFGLEGGCSRGPGAAALLPPSLPAPVVVFFTSNASQSPCRSYPSAAAWDARRDTLPPSAEQTK